MGIPLLGWGPAPGCLRWEAMAHASQCGPCTWNRWPSDPAVPSSLGLEGPNLEGSALLMRAPSLQALAGWGPQRGHPDPTHDTHIMR